jgi:LmbE family N-acetylglucosaminyl deacetylase
MRRFEWAPTVALAIYAHPDDADVAAGGSLAAWAQAGGECHLLIIGDGSKGSHDVDASVEQLSRTRAGELNDAARELGVASVISLGLRDGEFTNDSSLRGELVAQVRRLQPDLVLGPDPTATFFNGVYVNHRDHRETGWALLDAVAPASAMPLYFPDAGPPHAVTDLLMSGTLEASVVVDISATVENKVRAVLAHGSQTGGDSSGVREIIEGRARRAGREVGVSFGESFRHVALQRG